MVASKRACDTRLSGVQVSKAPWGGSGKPPLEVGVGQGIRDTTDIMEKYRSGALGTLSDQFVA